MLGLVLSLLMMTSGPTAAAGPPATWSKSAATATRSSSLFDHVTIRASDREASEQFYATVLATLGVEWGEFSIAPATHEKPVTRGLHIGFAAPSREHVDAFWQAGTEAGYRDDGEPVARHGSAAILRRLLPRPA